MNLRNDQQILSYDGLFFVLVVSCRLQNGRYIQTLIYKTTLNKNKKMPKREKVFSYLI